MQLLHSWQLAVVGLVSHVRGRSQRNEREPRGPLTREKRPFASERPKSREETPKVGSGGIGATEAATR
jgi:hypothetical protein